MFLTNISIFFFYTKSVTPSPLQEGLNITKNHCGQFAMFNTMLNLQTDSTELVLKPLLCSFGRKIWPKEYSLANTSNSFSNHHKPIKWSFEAKWTNIKLIRCWWSLWYSCSKRQLISSWGTLFIRYYRHIMNYFVFTEVSIPEHPGGHQAKAHTM